MNEAVPPFFNSPVLIRTGIVVIAFLFIYLFKVQKTKHTPRTMSLASVNLSLVQIRVHHDFIVSHFYTVIHGESESFLLLTWISFIISNFVFSIFLKIPLLGKEVLH